MVPLLIKLMLAPGLMAAATIADRRWGPRRGGLISAFPALVGPLLLVTAIAHGPHAAARAASGTLLGLAGLAAFIAVYGRSAAHVGWAVSLAVGWVAAVCLTTTSALWGGAGWLVNAFIAGGTLLVASRVLGPPRRIAAPSPRGRGRRILLVRAGLTGLLVTGLAAAVGAFGPTVGGLLAALPILASLLAVFTHRESGGRAATELLRGTIVGMTGFVAFCVIVAATSVPLGGPVAFSAATAAALLAQVALARGGGGYPSARKSAGRSGEASASPRLNPSASRSAA